MEYLQNVEILYFYMVGKSVYNIRVLRKKKKTLWRHSSNNNFNAEKRKPESSVSCSCFECGPG